VAKTGNIGLLLDGSVLTSVQTYLVGLVALVLAFLLWLVFSNSSGKRARALLSAKAKRIDGALENSRFMNNKERDFNFPPHKFTKLKEAKKDGIPVYAVYSPKKKELDINIAAPMHGLIIGSTGSGKTTTFINPVIQILAATSAGSSMICTDPKGELFQLHSQRLVDRGYRCMVLDLRDPYYSSVESAAGYLRPLSDVYGMRK
jgi:type IV secretion system protein VirD4